MERPKGQAETQVLRNCRRSQRTRSSAKSQSPPSRARGVSVADALAQFTCGNPRLQHTAQVAKALVEAHGKVGVRTIGVAQVAFLNLWLARYENAFSKHRRAGAAKRILRYLWEEHGAPKLHDKIVKVAQPKPRNVTATAAERTAIMTAAPDYLRAWLLLCSDCAIRSGTAARLGPADYDAAARMVTFRTKYQNAQHLPVTAELAALLDRCTDTSVPFVKQLGWPFAHTKSDDYTNLNHAFLRLKKSIGITRKLTPHDLRRTTARNVYTHTRDLRVVQSLLGHSELRTTLWYLQDSIAPVPVSTLELAKLPPATERPQ